MKMTNAVSSRQPFIIMMQAIDFWMLYYLPKRWHLHQLTIQDYSSGAVESTHTLGRRLRAACAVRNPEDVAGLQEQRHHDALPGACVGRAF